MALHGPLETAQIELDCVPQLTSYLDLFGTRISDDVRTGISSAPSGAALDHGTDLPAPPVCDVRVTFPPYTSCLADRLGRGFPPVHIHAHPTPHRPN